VDEQERTLELERLAREVPRVPPADRPVLSRDKEGRRVLALAPRDARDAALGERHLAERFEAAAERAQRVV